MESESKEGLMDCSKIGQGRSSPQYQNLAKRRTVRQECPCGVDDESLRGRRQPLRECPDVHNCRLPLALRKPPAYDSAIRS